MSNPASVTSARRRLHGGLTLAELLVVLTIASVLFGIGMPALGGMLRAQRLRLAASDFLGAVELARGQAIALGQRVLLAPSSDTLDWAEGWAVFIDRDGDRRPGAGDEVIMRHAALTPASGAEAVRFSMNFGTQQGPPYLAYNSMGRGCSYLSSAVARFGTVTLAQGEQVRRVKINMQGRARLCDPARDASSCTGAEP